MKRKFYRLFWLGIAVLLIYGTLHGNGSGPSTYCGLPVCHSSYSTPGPDDSPAHPLRNLRRALTRGKS